MKVIVVVRAKTTSPILIRKDKDGVNAAAIRSLLLQSQILPVLLMPGTSPISWWMQPATRLLMIS